MKPKRRQLNSQQRSFLQRCHFMTAGLLLFAVVLSARAVHLQVFNKSFLNEQAAARHLRMARISAHRGTVTDRNGEPLAVSTPVDSVWVNPRELLKYPDKIPALAVSLDLERESLTRRLTRNAGKEFMYLKRHMNPADAAAVEQRKFPGVYLLREYRRYYPVGEVAGHLIGFTNIDDVGQEGLELAFDHWMAGTPGKKKVLKDRYGHVVEDVESIESPKPGRNLVTSIDLRIQYLAYRELKSAMQQHKAVSGSVVVLDVLTGEVLAMANQPSYNPNDRSQFIASRYRNRSITDIFEPGSSFKPLIIAAALESGQYQPDSRVNTSPGRISVGSKVIEDSENLGRIDLTTILVRSSNVGATMVAMTLKPSLLWEVLSNFGIGRLTSSGFPGESAGLLSYYENWRPISQATLAYGYGLSLTPLQLAQAYAAIGAGGLRRPVSLLRIDSPPIARRVVREETAQAVLGMLETVTGPTGSGRKAAVAGYRVAGKTGTARKSAAGGYVDDRHTAVFAGIAPVSDPRLAIVVVIDEPSAGEYYGGAVAAPVFSKVASGALRILAVTPDLLVDPVKQDRTTMMARRQ